MDSDGRKSLRVLSLLLVGWGALQVLVISAFSHDPEVLSFGFGPAFVGLMLFLISFFNTKEPKNPLPMWRNAAFWGLNLILWVPNMLFDYHFPAKLHPYVLILYSIVTALLLFWPRPPKAHPTQGGQKQFGGGSLISN
jgi:hypothetical protein